MAKLIKKRLRPINIPRGRKSDKNAETTSAGKKNLRTVLGSCKWVQREVRPDISARSALGMRRISHKSHALRRKCSSTLAAEAQAMSDALGEVESIRGMYEEMINPYFDIIQWSAKTRHRGLLVAGRTTDPNKELPQLLSICDAKSLYDHLHKESSGTAADRRTAIEIQITRSSLDAQDGQVRSTMGRSQWYVC